MKYYPHVYTKVGSGRLFRIEGNKAIVEFDYMYLVELPIADVCFDGIELSRVEGGESLETLCRGEANRESSRHSA